MRFERKYRLDNFALAVAEQTVRGHPASFRRLFLDRQVNNLYLDTPGLESFRDNVAGVPNRRKYRLRWYNEDPQPVLEIKKKENQVGEKEVIPLPDFHWDDWQKNIARLARRLGQPALQPMLLNSYRRSYWGTPDGRFRITIDWNLRFAWPGSAPAGRPLVWNYRLEGLVLELKYDFSADDAAQEIFQYLPFRQTKSSKYVAGVNLLYG